MVTQALKTNMQPNKKKHAMATNRNDVRAKAAPEQSSHKQAVNALIGIDPEAVFRQAVALFARIGFKGARATLLSVVEPVNLTMPIPSGANLSPIFDMVDEQVARKWRTEQAEIALASAGKQLLDQGIAVKKELRSGFAPGELLKFADEMKANLLVAACTHHGALSSALLGSVSRAAVIGAGQSILLARHDLPEGKPLTAVLATDHSDYCNEGINQLIAFHPTGIRKITVLSALGTGFLKDTSLIPNLSAFSEEEENWREQTLRVKTEEVCDQLWKVRVRAEPMMVKMSPQEAINHAMKKSGADLLIMSAHGHGFLERAMIGSLSLHEAVAENYSILILRP